MPTLIPFQFHNSPLTALTHADGNPWFIAAEACAILAIKNVSDACERLDADEKDTIALSEGIRGNPTTLIINESGLYALALRSRKKEAQAFRKRVTNEVLPSIRKTGHYDAREQKALTPAQMFLEQAKVNVALEQRQDTLEAQQVAQAEQIATLTARRPPPDRVDPIGWLRMFSKPRLERRMLANFKAACRRREDPILWRPDHLDWPVPYYTEATLLAAYEEATRDLYLFADHTRDPGVPYRAKVRRH